MPIELSLSPRELTLHERFVAFWLSTSLVESLPMPAAE